MPTPVQSTRHLPVRDRSQRWDGGNAVWWGVTGRGAGCAEGGVGGVGGWGVVGAELIVPAGVGAGGGVVRPATARAEVVEVTNCVRLLHRIDAPDDHPVVAGSG